MKLVRARRSSGGGAVRARERIGFPRLERSSDEVEVLMNRLARAATALTIAVAGCGSPEPTAPAGEAPAAAPPEAAAPAAAPGGAAATLRTADGTAAGRATAVAAGDRLMISVQAEGLPPGDHGVHVHMTGRCDAPGFGSAGGHWNPADARHGLENPQGPHAGDMPNLTVGQDGRGSLEYRLAGGDLAGLLDADGSALVVHALADDQRTDPAGDSGDRIACGVFGRDQGAAGPRLSATPATGPADRGAGRG
ncbi:superoxide dismutase family protein [uncultured Brevundimonas sp.]|uniref:superoxide dismutase family protein n=1 Tax=uncultured Brevundimonas sp. TaxID=213418 RepID=UPI002627FE6E|nr:superoxide dismutase family protein [uncultured Brevundimonas sp.]